MRWTVVLVALAMPVGAAAQDETVSDDIVIACLRLDSGEIVVTAGGNLAPSSADRAQSVQILDDLDQHLGARVENRLRDEAGLAQFRRSDGRSAHPTSQGVTMRGLGGNASSRALVLLDGVPQADPFGGWIAWSAFDNVPLAGARIVRGGGSGVDGAGALAGTISLSSTIDQSVHGSLAYGSRNATDVVAGIGTALGSGEVAVDGRWSRGDGFIPIVAGQRGLVDRAAPFDQAGLGLRARVDVGNEQRIEVALRGWRDRRDRGTDFSQSRIKGLDASIRYLLTPVSGWQASLLAYAQLREFDTGFASVAADRNSVAPALIQRVPATGLGARLELRPPINDGNPLRLGIDWRAVDGETQEQFFFTGTVPGRTRVAGGKSRTFGLFADYFATLGDVTFNASARADRWDIAPGYRTERNIGGTLRSDDRFAARSGWEGTGRIGARWDGPIALRAAAYTGWRLPTLNELYRPFRVGVDATAANELLRPERLKGAEAGLDWNGGNASVAITGFWNRLDHAIANVTLARGPGNFPGVGFVAAGGSYAQRQNLDAIIAKGIEAQGSVATGPLTWRASYAFTDANVRASGAALTLNDRRPAQVARHMASLTLIGDFAPFGFDLRLRHTGAQNEDDIGLQRLRAATTVDASLSFAINGAIELGLRGENLFDVLVPAAFGAGGVIERASPRTLWFGASARF